MKSFVKNNLKIIGAFILGVIVCGSTVFASSFLAKDVTYTPNDETFDVSNVGSALDKLYELDKLLGSIENTECVSGSFVCGPDCIGSNGQIVESAFEPSIFIEYPDFSSINFYNSNLNTEKYAYYSASSVGTGYPLSAHFRIKNGALYVFGYGSDNYGATRYYIACK